MPISRRTLLAGLAGASACTRGLKRKDGRLHLRLASWGEQVELRAFRRVIARYEALHPDVAIDLEEISYVTRSQIDTQLAAGVGPDLLRVQYIEVGRYTPSNALIDLSQYVPAGLGEQFTPPTWTAVLYQGRPHALPHHTDTSVIFYNKTLFRKLGIRAPERIEESWHWSEFTDVARAIKKHCEYGFAMNWAFGGSFRWLNFLYQHGGDLLQLPSSAALQTMEWTQSFFRNGLVPMSDSAKSTEHLEVLFANGVIGMYFDPGPQSIAEQKIDFEWAATFQPRDKRFAADLGGNAIGVTRDAKDPARAADFALFLTNEENMRDFAQAAQFLPVRRKLVQEGLHYKYRPDEMAVHLEQSKTVPVDLARSVTPPAFHHINRVLGDELDLAFTGGQTAEASVQHLAEATDRALKAT